MAYNLTRDYEVAEVFNGGAGQGSGYPGYTHSKEVLGITDSDLGARTLKIGGSIGSHAAAWASKGIRYQALMEFFELNGELLKGLFSINSRKRNSSLEGLSKAFVGEDTRFGDLEDLNIPATDITESIRKPFTLNYKTAPDVKVYKGIMGSSSAPFLYDSVKIKIDGKTREFIDVGFSGYNLVLEAMSHESVREIINIGVLDEKSAKLLEKYYMKMAFWSGIPREVQEVETEVRENKKVYSFNPNLPGGHLLDSGFSSIVELSDQCYLEAMKFFSSLGIRKF